MNDHEHCVDRGSCWQERDPCPALDAFYEVSRGETLIEFRELPRGTLPLLTALETPGGVWVRIVVAETVRPLSINLSPYQALQLEEFLRRARHIRDQFEQKEVS